MAGIEQQADAVRRACHHRSISRPSRSPCPCGGERRCARPRPAIQSPSCPMRRGTAATRARPARAGRRPDVAPALHRAGGLGEHHHLAAAGPQQVEMRPHGRDLLLDGAVAQLGAVPARHEGQPVARRAPPSAPPGRVGNLWPFSMPVKPACLASARQVSSGVSPPSSRQVVVGPADRVGCRCRIVFAHSVSSRSAAAPVQRASRRRRAPRGPGRSETSGTATSHQSRRRPWSARGRSR